MKKLLMPLALVYALTAGWAPLVVAQQAKGAPIDFRACKYREGKNFKDLQKVSTEFREWANKQDVSYAAWTLHPQFHPGLGYDFGWLGSWPDGESFGVSMEKWRSAPEQQEAMNKVMDCGLSHQLAVLLPINAPDGTPEDGVLMFYRCSLNEGVSMQKAYAAHLDAGDVMKAMGSLSVSWMFQPAIAAGDIDFDYFHVIGFYRYSDLGATMDTYFNGGAKAQQQKILSKVSSCKTPVVFDAVSVRARDER